MAGEMPMLSSIQVRQKDRREKMFPLSRINFGKMYTVEHNVKVYDFGDVRKSSLFLLREQWKWVLHYNIQATTHQKNNKEVELDSEDSDSEDDFDKTTAVEEVEEVEPEVELPATGTALWPWSANDRGQLAFNTGDAITIERWADENWGRGRNARTGRKGLFPRNYVNISS
jgi:hypothetical protein